MAKEVVEKDGVKFKRVPAATALSGWQRYVRGPQGQMIWRGVNHNARHLIAELNELASKAKG